MRKKSGFTIVEQAITLVPEFEKVVRKLEQQVTLRGQSKSTLQNYIRRIALFVVHFEKLPEQIDPEEINEYLVSLARDPKSPSRSSFKHMVYGLRYYYRLLGMNKNAIALPSLKKDTKLPVILNHQELKELFAAPTLLKQRIVLTLIYSAGLRGQEVIILNLQFIPAQSPDIDTLITRKKLPETNLQRFQRITGIDPCRCPVCKKGSMVRVRELPRIRSPSWRLTFHRSTI